MKPKKKKRNVGKLFFCTIFMVSLIMFSVSLYDHYDDYKKMEAQGVKLRELKTAYTSEGDNSSSTKCEYTESPDSEKNTLPVILPEYEKLYEMNQDLAGWLYIEDTCIDYPVMQTPADENFYLRRDFYGEDNRNGCLILDTQSFAGIGTAENSYDRGAKPTTNLIIHGHTMRTGAMFGELDLYKDREYGLAHRTICFDSLYEKREYELIAVFYSQVYEEESEAFKYYSFFQADSPEEFDDWYENIKKLSLYDTHVTAEYGDEFITLSCCSYHVTDGRFVVVGKRIP